MSLRLFFTSVFLFFVLLISFPTNSFAQNDGAGIGLSPATIEESADPGESQTYQLSVTNLSSVPQIYYLYTKDITSVGEGGTPIFATGDEEVTGYELTEWLTLSAQELTIEAGKSATLDVTIDVPENATPGSHFGGIFVSVEPPRLRSTGAAVGYEVANIISIRVAGDAVENAQIRSFSTGNFIYSTPSIDFHARVENKGTVLVRPYGPLEIHNMFGKRVGFITFNDQKAGIFPMTTRDFEVTWDGEGPGFGRYQAILSLVYGEQGRQATISSTASFWILPMNIIGPALGVLAFLLLLVYISVKLYIRRTLQVSSGATRRIARRRRGGGGGMSALLLVTVVMLAVTALFLIILLALFA